jgi:hypothetical protein
VTPVAQVPVTRELVMRSGVMRSRLVRMVRVAAGRLDVQLHAARAAECQISILTPSGEIVLSLLPPGEPNLLSMSQRVKAGRHRVEIDCDSRRRRSYTLSISAIAQRQPAAAKSS